jgi:beta-glucanase (GH16 family)
MGSLKLLYASLVIALTVSSSAYSNPLTPAQWTQTFGEEFNGSTLDPQKWGTAYSEANNTEHYVIVDHTLKLRIEKDIPAGKVSDADTWRSFAQKYGWFEIRAKTARPTRGLHAAFWLIPWDNRYNNLTQTGLNGSRKNSAEGFEIDIFELPGDDPHGGLFTNYWGPTTGFNTTSLRKNFGKLDLSAAFHDYALDWEPDRLTWYMDGVEIRHSDGHSPKVPFYIMLDHYAGAWMPMDPNAIYPLDFEIVSVKAFQRKERVSLPTNFAKCDGSIGGSVTYNGGSITPIQTQLDDASLKIGGQIDIMRTRKDGIPVVAFHLQIQNVENLSQPQGFAQALSAKGAYVSSLKQGKFELHADSNMMIVKLDGGTTNSQMLRFVCE